MTNVQLDVRVFDDLLLDLVVKNFSLLAFVTLRKSSDNAKTILTDHWEKSCEIVLTQIYDQCVV